MARDNLDVSRRGILLDVKSVVNGGTRNLLNRTVQNVFFFLQVPEDQGVSLRIREVLHDRTVKGSLSSQDMKRHLWKTALKERRGAGRKGGGLPIIDLPKKGTDWILPKKISSIAKNAESRRLYGLVGDRAKNHIILLTLERKTDLLIQIYSRGSRLRRGSLSMP